MAGIAHAPCPSAPGTGAGGTPTAPNRHCGDLTWRSAPGNACCWPGPRAPANPRCSMPWPGSWTRTTRPIPPASCCWTAPPLPRAAAWSGSCSRTPKPRSSRPGSGTTWPSAPKTFRVPPEEIAQRIIEALDAVGLRRPAGPPHRRALGRAKTAPGPGRDPGHGPGAGAAGRADGQPRPGRRAGGPRRGACRAGCHRGHPADRRTPARGLGGAHGPGHRAGTRRGHRPRRNPGANSLPPARSARSSSPPGSGCPATPRPSTPAARRHGQPGALLLEASGPGRDPQARRRPAAAPAWTCASRRAEAWCVRGANGSGKSTFALTLGGLLPQASGTVLATAGTCRPAPRRAPTTGAPPNWSAGSARCSRNPSTSSSPTRWPRNWPSARGTPCGPAPGSRCSRDAQIEARVESTAGPAAAGAPGRGQPLHPLGRGKTPALGGHGAGRRAAGPDP